MRARRGQAATELALGATLFVTLLLLGIYSSETALLTLKVQEAGNFALWDATGRRVHEYRNASASYAPFDALPATVAGATTLRYKDFDGTGTARTGIKLARTEGSALQVQCQAANNIDFQVKDPGGLRHAATYSDLQQFYAPGKGFVTCQATAQLAALKMPSKFLEGSSGFFNNGSQAAKMVQRPTMRVCSDRWCNGKLGVLVGTWALEGPMGDRNNAESPLNESQTPTTNPTYNKMVRQLFDDNGQGEASPSKVKQFVAAVAGETPAYDENTFFMSSRGIESSYVEYITGLTGKMPGAAPQTRGYDTNGAPLDDSTPNVWAWQLPGNPTLAQRTPTFLGLPKLAPP